MSLDEDIGAVRTGVTVATGDHVALVRVAGTGAHDLLDRVSPRPLFVRTGQMLHTVLLDPEGTPLADAYLCCDEDDYLVLAEGLSGPVLTAYLREHAGGLAVELEDRSDSHAVLAVDGPYSWELVADLTTPDVIGLPYLAFFHTERFTCFRAGTTGEFGYLLVAPRAGAAGVRDAVESVGRRFDLRAVGLAALERCALEVGFFNVRRQVRQGLTPVELQLQWRLGSTKSYVGSEAIAARRKAPRGRVAMIASAGELASDAAVELGGMRVGTVLDAGWSPTRGEHIGVALLDRPVSHAGLAGFTSNGCAVRTVSAPGVNNRSLYVDPQRHAWATRATDTFPPLVRAWS
jgi:glycine cleavage system aminomethyltransferase T